MNPKILYYLILTSSITVRAAEISALHIIPNGQVPSGDDKVHRVDLAPGEHVLISMGPGNGNYINPNSSGSPISKNALRLPDEKDTAEKEIQIIPQIITPAGDSINLSPEQQRLQSLIDQQARPNPADLNDKIKKYFDFTKMLRESEMKTRVKLPRIVFIGNEDDEKYRIIESIIGFKGSLTPPTTSSTTTQSQAQPQPQPQAPPPSSSTTVKSPRFKSPIKFKLIKNDTKSIKVDGKVIAEGSGLFEALKPVLNQDEDKDFVLIEKPVEVEITGPELQSIAFVDLPWRVPEYANKSCNDPILSRLLHKYLHQPWNLTVAIGKSVLPFTHWDSLKLVRTYDEKLKHVYTVGVDPFVEAEALGLVLGLQKAYPAMTKDEMYYWTDENSDSKPDETTNTTTSTSTTGTNTTNTSTTGANTASTSTTGNNTTSTPGTSSANTTASNPAPNTSNTSTSINTTEVTTNATLNTTASTSAVAEAPCTSADSVKSTTFKVCDASTCGLNGIIIGLQSKLVQVWSALRPEALVVIEGELDKLNQRLKGYDGYNALPGEKEKFSALIDQVTPVLNDRLIFSAEDREGIGCIESGPLDLIKGSIFDTPTTPAIQPKRTFWSEIFSTYQRSIGQLQKIPDSVDSTAVNNLIEELKCNGPTRKTISELKKLVLNAQLETLKTPKMNLLAAVQANWKETIHFGLEAKDSLEAFPDFKKALKETTSKILADHVKVLTKMNEQIESADYTSGWTFNFYDDPKASIWVDLMKTNSLEDAVKLFNETARVGFMEICRTHEEIQPRLIIDNLLEKRIVKEIIEEFKKTVNGEGNVTNNGNTTTTANNATPASTASTTSSTPATSSALKMSDLIEMSKESKDQLTKLKGVVTKFANLINLARD